MNERKANGEHQFLFAVALLASLTMCALLGYLLLFFVSRYDARTFKVAILVVPQFALFSWVARDMWKGLRATISMKCHGCWCPRQRMNR